MEILTQNNRQELLDFLLQVKPALEEWVIADVRLTAQSDRDFTAQAAADLICALYADKAGKILLCNATEILMLMRVGQNKSAVVIAKDIERKLPIGSCAVQVEALTLAGIEKFAILITYKRPPPAARFKEPEDDVIVLVADDDMHMRLLVKKGVGAGTKVHEVADGRNVFDVYKKYVPDILFLDIHLPNVEGHILLQQILVFDPEAYIVMLSADSTPENVKMTMHQGARGFLSKPFTKEKLQDYINKCRDVP